jgi:hypothetical protein
MTELFLGTCAAKLGRREIVICIQFVIDGGRKEAFWVNGSQGVSEKWISV